MYSASVNNTPAPPSQLDASAALVNQHPNRPPGRPACALANFGFGGKLVCMFPQQKLAFHSQQSVAAGGLKAGPVVIYRASAVLPPHLLPPDMDSFPSPLVDAEDSEAMEHIEKKAAGASDPAQPHALLWELVRLAAVSRGILRSDGGVADPNSPEAKVRARAS
jgi:hypothetical protein